MIAVDSSVYLASVAQGATVDNLLKTMSADRLNPLDAIKVLMQAFNLSLRDAKSALVEHPAWDREARVMAEMEDLFFDTPFEEE